MNKTHDSIKEGIPSFNIQEVPKTDSKDGLAKVLREKAKRRADNDICKMERLQKEWLKTNKVKEHHAPKTRYEPYSGKEIPTNVLTSPELKKYRPMLMFSPIKGNKDYGDSTAIHLV